eukprot:CAMPEP_0115647074 /NCGR_PEP_ID=MMETSP0272-20121206/39260_1 /TAXON_ID=71861 /ORGANISM="Scrippsiella trochoidea, Strain CCMP3099" /LENGTH=159 /DNA_ID=CAMNT_0003084625 /DNA_START=46 /DNA_END=521 /DNA_ORIENTATION=+
MALNKTSRASQGGQKKQAAMKKATAMKAKRATKVAKGRMAKALVFRGSKEKTTGGLKQESLMKNKRGKIVSKRQSAIGKRRYNNVEAWVDSVMEARKALHISGFVAINGKTLQGKALYVKTKSLLMSRLGSRATAAASSSSCVAAAAATTDQQQPSLAA